MILDLGRICCAVAVLGFLVDPSRLVAQTRSMAQDSTLNNLVHPPGYQTAPPGSLGRVRNEGTGPRQMILIPGLGFSGDVFDEFMTRWAGAYRMHAVTLPGFGGTPALPMPDAGESYAAIAWTRSAEQAIIAFMDKEKIERATLVAHWALATQIALRLALEHPQRFDSVIVIAGPAKSYYASSPGMLDWATEQRARFADGLGRKWFRTVTRKTWDDNNFMSYDYAVNPRRGLYLWREAASPPLTVWIRYLLEFYTIDVTPELARLKVPVLVVRPGFDDPAYYVEQGMEYMKNLCVDSWRGVEKTGTGTLEFATVAGSRLFVMYDKPEELDSVIRSFLERVQKN
jgi:pimeloyl-ACP methyl ester carboxylesterase